MDQVLEMVKLQIEEEKQEIAARAERKKQVRKKKVAEANPEQEVVKIQLKGKTINKVGTFGTSERNIFPKKTAHVDYISSADRQHPRVTGGYISKLPRAPTAPSKPPEQILTPNYAFTKKSTPAPIISTKPFKPTPALPKPSLKSQEYQIAPEIDQVLHSVSTADSEFDSFFKAKAEWEQNLKAELKSHPELNRILFPKASALYTASSDNKPNAPKLPGPGSYMTSHTFTERSTKSTVFSKAERQKPQKPSDEHPLFPNYDLVLKAPASFKYKLDSEKTPQILFKEAEEEQREILQSILYKTRDIGLSEVVYDRVLGGVIAPISEVPVRDKRAWMGPGTYAPNYESIEGNILGKVKYYEDLVPSHPPRFEYPGPGYYEVEGLEDPDVIGGYIALSPRSRTPDVDRRPALDPNIDFIKPKIPSALIQPEHIEKPTEFSDLGPGVYYPTYKLVERRTDIDVLPFVNVKEKEPETDNRLPLIINEALVRPGIPGFTYHQPTEIHPAHIPESFFHPEQWKFYDYSADNKFERPPAVQFAIETYSDFPIAEKDREALRRINMKLRGEGNLPEVGTYDPEPVKSRAPAYDFAKLTSRDPTFNANLEDDSHEGDVLVLEPYIKERVPMLVNMEKAVGRPEAQDEADDRIELKLDPKIDLIKKRPITLVNMQKDLGRPVKEQEEDERLILNPDYKLLQKHVPMLVNIEKQTGRDPEVLEPEEYVLINHEEVKKPVRSGVDMSRQTGRESEKLPEEDFVVVENSAKVDNLKKKVLGAVEFGKMTGREQEKEPELEREVHTAAEALPDIMKAYNSTIPEPHVPSFDRFAPRMQEIVEDETEIPFLVFPRRK